MESRIDRDMLVADSGQFTYARIRGILGADFDTLIKMQYPMEWPLEVGMVLDDPGNLAAFDHETGTLVDVYHNRINVFGLRRHNIPDFLNAFHKYIDFVPTQPRDEAISDFENTAKLYFSANEALQCASTQDLDQYFKLTSQELFFFRTRSRRLTASGGPEKIHLTFRAAMCINT